MKTKALCLLMALLMALSLTGCVLIASDDVSNRPFQGMFVNTGASVELRCARCGSSIQIPADQYDPEWTYICEACDLSITMGD